MPKPITQTAVAEATQDETVPVRKPAVKKAPAKKAPAKAVGVPAEPKTQKGGLRKGQVRVLKFLSKVGQPQDRKTIAEKAPCDLANCVELLGSHDPDVRKANDVKHFPSLISLGFVKAKEQDVNGKAVVFYEATASGKKAAAKAE